ncbi:GGDEF domain-containing protein [Neptuniibacter sp.]|uniref:GGDEF domain-containing protein n=1 Tax=Neptuniibacter sp. TaxID=1962643 RepID=UPI0026370E18|nr:GGDEF domain-containing protein [Neptuniibacter sp.]MCP4598482.1 GGDEF domain-containing protein [Neptuniibacter sp.]
MDGSLIRKRFKTRIIVIAVILSVGILLMGGYLLYLSSDLRKTWNNYSDFSESRSAALAELHRAVGYGGFIHNFKNYVLRQDSALLPKLEADAERAFQAIDSYKGSGLNSQEEIALEIIRTTFTDYRNKITIATQAVASGESSVAVDAKVKVNDGPALTALGILQEENRSYYIQMTDSMNAQLWELINVLLIGLLAMPFVVLAAYHYHDVFLKVIDLSIEKQKVQKELANTAVQAAIAEEKHQEMAHEAHHCDLTRIANRKAFMKTGKEILSQVQELDEKVSVLFVDVDDFKAVNDEFGHDIGDDVLVEVANRLTMAIRDGDLVARIGGDEFALIICGKDSFFASQNLAERLIEVMNQSYSHLAEGLEVTCSVGGALYPDDGANLDELMRAADERMYCVKKSGKNGVYLQDS